MTAPAVHPHRASHQHRRFRVAVAVALSALLAGGVAVAVRSAFFEPHPIRAYFATATAIYPGDEVRISGLKVGTIESIEPHGAYTELTMRIDPGVPIPADANAVIVAQNLVAARYVQLTPAYRPGDGPTMADGTVIPLDRTAIPVEWDEVKTQLDRLATDLGPTGAGSTTSIGRFVDTAATAMDGNGDKLRQTLAQLSGVGRILANGGGNLVDVIKNLQTFVTTLRDSNTQIVSFQNRLATLSSVLDGGRSDLDAALTNLAEAVGEVRRFVAGSRNQTAEQIQRLANVTDNLVAHEMDIENILHVAPNAFANGYNIYNPDTGTPWGSFSLNNFSNPLQFICGAIGSVENTTAPETAKLCAQYLGPALRLFNFNALPFPLNPILQKSASPENIIYSEPGLAPGGAGPKPGPPEIPPAVSAYTGLDQPQGPPFDPAPAQLPATLPALLLPTETPGDPQPSSAPLAPAAPPS